MNNNDKKKLQAALNSGNTQGVYELLGDINFHFACGETPLLCALASSLDDVVEAMLETADINLANAHTQVTPIQRAYMCSFKLNDTIKKILTQKPNVNLLDSNRSNVVTKVIDNQDSVTLQYLLSHAQVNLNVTCRNKRPLFIEVIHNKDFKSLDVLLTHASKKQLEDFEKQFSRYELPEQARENVVQKLQSSILNQALQKKLPQKEKTARNKI